MRKSTGTRKQNRTHEEIKVELNERKAKYYLHIAQIDRRLEALDAPRERKPRAMSVNKALAQVKAAGYTVEELIQIANERKAVTA